MLLLRPPGVYRVQRDTTLLADVLRSGDYAAGRHVLDLGSGTGALALAAARAGAASVVAVDLSSRSVAATWVNSRLHRAPVAVRRGDLFAPVADRKFDLIMANPPYVPAATAVLPRHRITRCWDAGRDGRAILDRICAGAADRLTAQGVVLVVHSAVCGEEHTIARLAEAGLAGKVIERTRISFGPVMRARAALLEARGLLEPGQSIEELVVVAAHHAG
ncbi:MAG TPA: HemK2/MTQ2 family protein methyltransferase [Pseudonocardiaceae bacterium]|nr:HemK2/MTQ2 family protein methyltransferase [Pseudonocardiaceae bacterium]